MPTVTGARGGSKGGAGPMIKDMAIVNKVLIIRDILERATTFDSWGQVLEADEEYTKLIGEITKLTNFSPSKGSGPPPFTEHQLKFLENTAAAAHLRARGAQDLTGEFGNEVRLDQMLKILKMIEPVLTTEEPNIPEFPVKEIVAQSRNIGIDHLFERAGHKTLNNSAHETMAALDDDDEEGYPPTGGGKGHHAPTSSSLESRGSLKPYKHFPGQTGITLKILRIQLQDPQKYIEPTITVSIKDGNGNPVVNGDTQDTPISGNIDDDYVYFNHDVHIQLPLEQLGLMDCAIFLEFKHYKPKKQKQSTKCWSMLEMDELNAEEELRLEIYAKPADYKRKKLTLMTDKDFFIYVQIIRHTDK